jgi:hypothetical protein
MELSLMTKDDVLFGYRLQLFDLAGRASISNACRVLGVHRSTSTGPASLMPTIGTTSRSRC